MASTSVQSDLIQEQTDRGSWICSWILFLNQVNVHTGTGHEVLIGVDYNGLAETYKWA